MALILTTTTGRVDPSRIESFQVTFQRLFARRFEEAPLLTPPDQSSGSDQRTGR